LKCLQPNKANFSEQGIYLVKSRLFRLLRHKLSENWPKYLPYIVHALNQRPLERLGGLRPCDVTSVLDDVKVAQAQTSKGFTPFSEPSWREQEQNKIEYEKSNNPFKVGTFVFLDEPDLVFKKSFHVQISANCYFFPAIWYFIRSSASSKTVTAQERKIARSQDRKTARSQDRKITRSQ
jgi:hypothetical protein